VREKKSDERRTSDIQKKGGPQGRMKKKRTSPKKKKGYISNTMAGAMEGSPRALL